jgi:hypothetical protein
MNRASLAWALLLALYWIGGLASCHRELERIRAARYLTPKRRRREQRLAVLAGVLWPLFELAELLLAVAVERRPARGSR